MIRKFAETLKSFAGRDISSLMPVANLLAHMDSTSGDYADISFRRCVRLDGDRTLQADNWLATYVTKYSYELASGVIRKCPEPVEPGKNPTKTVDCITKADAQRWIRSMWIGNVAQYSKVVRDAVKKQDRDYIIIGNRVFDVTPYTRIATINVTSLDGSKKTVVNPFMAWLPADLTLMLARNPGVDITSQFREYNNSKTYERCFLKMFYAGEFQDIPDYCLIARPVLTGVSLLFFSFVLVKVQETFSL